MDPDDRKTAVKKALFLSVSCWCPVFTVSGAEYDPAKCEKYAYRDLCGERNLRGKDEKHCFIRKAGLRLWKFPAKKN